MARRKKKAVAADLPPPVDPTVERRVADDGTITERKREEKRQRDREYRARVREALALARTRAAAEEDHLEEEEEQENKAPPTSSSGWVGSLLLGAVVFLGALGALQAASRPRLYAVPTPERESR